MSGSSLRRGYVDGRDKPGHDDKGSPPSRSTKPNICLLKIERRATVPLAMTNPIDSKAQGHLRNPPGRGHFHMEAELVIAALGAKKKKCPGGRRKPLKRLVSAKGIQGNPSLFL
jgi:hypothetical protein